MCSDRTKTKGFAPCWIVGHADIGQRRASPLCPGCVEVEHSADDVNHADAEVDDELGVRLRLG